MAYLDQSQTNHSAVISNIYGANWNAQTFTPAHDGPQTQVKLWLQKSGTPPNPLVVELRATTAGKPNASVLATQTIAEASVPNNSELTVTFDTPYSVTSGTVYAIVLSTTAGDVSHMYRSTGVASSLYAGGTYCGSSDSGANWTTYGFDLYFLTYTEFSSSSSCRSSSSSSRSSSSSSSSSSCRSSSSSSSCRSSSSSSLSSSIDNLVIGGNAPIDRDSYVMTGTTFIDDNNNITENCKLVEVQVWWHADQSSGNMILGIFRDNGTQYVPVNHFHFPINHSAGFATYAINIDVYIGDKVGFYCQYGLDPIDMAAAAGSAFSISGDKTSTTTLKTAWIPVANTLSIRVLKSYLSSSSSSSLSRSSSSSSSSYSSSSSRSSSLSSSSSSSISSSSSSSLSSSSSSYSSSSSSSYSVSSSSSSSTMLSSSSSSSSMSSSSSSSSSSSLSSSSSSSSSSISSSSSSSMSSSSSSSSSVSSSSSSSLSSSSSCSSSSSSLSSSSSSSSSNSSSSSSSFSSSSSSSRSSSSSSCSSSCSSSSSSLSSSSSCSSSCSSSSSCRSSSSSSRSSSSRSSSSSSSSLTPFVKDLYCNAEVEKEGETNFYANAEVVQPLPTIPTDLFATDMQKGDLIRLSWTQNSNYGHNVYQVSPLPRVKLNTYPITGARNYLVGNLTVNQSYSFVIVGVNGQGVESGDSNIVSVTPTVIDYRGQRYLSFTYQVKINGVVRTDVILETVELGYGTSPSTTKFTIPRDPITTIGLPVMDDDVEVIVNGLSLFKGIVKNKDDIISAREKKVSYIAYSKVILKTYNPVTWAAILEAQLLYYGLNITDQNELQAEETIANYLGNYRLYYNMQTDLTEEYELGTGYWNRTVILGVNVIDYNITENNINKVTKVTVRGDRKRTRVAWKPLSLYSRVLNSTIYPGATFTYYLHQIDAFNVGNVKIEAFQSLSQPLFEFDETVSVVPSDYGMTTWEDDTIGPRQKVTRFRNPAADWRSAGAKIDYIYTKVGDQDMPVSALIELTSNPCVYAARTSTGHAVRQGRVPAENVDLGWVRYAMPTLVGGGGYRITYEYEEELPTEVTVGSGTPARIITDTQYKIFVNYAPDDNESVTDNTTEVLAAMTARANGELAKLNQSTLSGRIRIVGDETFDLKTQVLVDGEMLDVIRVVHSFVNGFTTDLELTNEKFRVNVPPYQNIQKTVYNETILKQHMDKLDRLALQIQQRIDTRYVEQDKNTITLTSPFALYGD